MFVEEHHEVFGQVFRGEDCQYDDMIQPKDVTVDK